MLKEYRYYNPKEEIAYRRLYNKDGSLKKSKGKLIPIVRYNYKRLRLNDTLKMQYYVVNPAWVKHSFSVHFYNEYDSLIRSDTLIMDKKRSIYFYNIPMHQKGSFSIKAICKISDQLSDQTEIDTSIFNYRVK